MKSKFHVLYEGEKFSSMLAHNLVPEVINNGKPVSIKDFESELLRTGHESVAEAEGEILQVMKDDESIHFAVLFQDGSLVNVFKR